MQEKWCQLVDQQLGISHILDIYIYTYTYTTIRKLNMKSDIERCINPLYNLVHQSVELTGRSTTEASTEDLGEWNKHKSRVSRCF